MVRLSMTQRHEDATALTLAFSLSLFLLCRKLFQNGCSSCEMPCKNRNICSGASVEELLKRQALHDALRSVQYDARFSGSKISNPRYRALRVALLQCASIATTEKHKHRHINTNTISHQLNSHVHSCDMSNVSLSFSLPYLLRLHFPPTEKKISAADCQLKGRAA
jgi:hypothetical protein